MSIWKNLHFLNQNYNLLEKLKLKHVSHLNSLYHMTLYRPFFPSTHFQNNNPSFIPPISLVSLDWKCRIVFIHLVITKHISSYESNLCYLRFLKSTSNFHLPSFWILFTQNSQGHILVTNKP